MEVTAQMTKHIPKKGDIITLAGKQFLVTDARQGEIYSAKRMKTIIIAFRPVDNLDTRIKTVRETIKDHLPINLIDAHLTVNGEQVEYIGYDEDLLKAENLTITYTK